MNRDSLAKCSKLRPNNGTPIGGNSIPLSPHALSSIIYMPQPMLFSPWLAPETSANFKASSSSYIIEDILQLAEHSQALLNFFFSCS